jgi:hypothetical protein
LQNTVTSMGMRPEEVQMPLAKALETHHLMTEKISLFEKGNGEKLNKRLEVDINGH